MAEKELAGFAFTIDFYFVEDEGDKRVLIRSRDIEDFPYKLADLARELPRPIYLVAKALQYVLEMDHHENGEFVKLADAMYTACSDYLHGIDDELDQLMSALEKPDG